MTVTTDEYRLEFAGSRVTTRPAADLLGRLKAVQDEVQTQTGRLDAMTLRIDPDAVDALIQWALSEDFAPDAAERIRREAWD
jgi:hypothetical protein